METTVGPYQNRHLWNGKLVKVLCSSHTIVSVMRLSLSVYFSVWALKTFPPVTQCLLRHRLQGPNERRCPSAAPLVSGGGHSGKCPGIIITSHPHQTHPLTQIVEVQDNKIQANPPHKPTRSASSHLLQSAKVHFVCRVNVICCLSMYQFTTSSKFHFQMWNYNILNLRGLVSFTDMQ